MEPQVSLLSECAHSVMRGAVAIAFGFALFSLLESLFFCVQQRKPWRSSLLDLKYAFLSFFYPPTLHFILAAVFGYQSIHPISNAARVRAPMLLVAGEAVAILFARDLLIYARHRIFHLPKIWAFHSIHHSSKAVNWLSASRFHPAENIIEAAAEIALFMACAAIGMRPRALFFANLTIAFYNFFEHSNLKWTFGSLRYVLVSPVFHRWHHSDAPQARNKNFAAMFSCIDLAFGTFYMPKGKYPKTTGLSKEEKAGHPKTFSGQIVYPFKAR